MTELEQLQRRIVELEAERDRAQATAAGLQRLADFTVTSYLALGFELLDQEGLQLAGQFQESTEYLTLFPNLTINTVMTSLQESRVSNDLNLLGEFVAIEELRQEVQCERLALGAMQSLIAAMPNGDQRYEYDLVTVSSQCLDWILLGDEREPPSHILLQESGLQAEAVKEEMERIVHDAAKA